MSIELQSSLRDIITFTAPREDPLTCSSLTISDNCGTRRFEATFSSKEWGVKPIHRSAGDKNYIIVRSPREQFIAARFNPHKGAASIVVVNRLYKFYFEDNPVAAFRFIQKVGSAGSTEKERSKLVSIALAAFRRPPTSMLTWDDIAFRLKMPISSDLYAEWIAYYGGNPRAVRMAHDYFAMLSQHGVI